MRISRGGQRVFVSSRELPKMRLFKKSSRRREPNMNESPASQDIPNQLSHVDQSSPSTKPKKPSLWKSLKHKFIKHDQKKKPRHDTVHTLQPNMNGSPASQDVPSQLSHVYQSSPSTKPKKPTLWKSLKNAESKLSDVSVEEQTSTGFSLHHGEDDESPHSDYNTSIDESPDGEGHEEYNWGQVLFMKWEIIDKIGEGSSGFVYKAKNVNSAEVVALKKARSLKYSMHLCREASIMKALNHPNIMKLIDVPTKDPYNERMVLVMEYVEAGSLASQILFLRRFTERKLWFPMKQMADAFEYLHAQNIVHRNIKLKNVLCSSQWNIKVIDFSMAKPFIHGKKMYPHWDRPGYMAPEITEHGYDGPPVDVWALGILFMKLFDGLQFDGHNIFEMSQDESDFNVENSPTTFARETLVSLLAAMLQKDPMERLTMTEIVNHPWFKENDPINYFRNAESKLSDEPVEEETPTDDERPYSDYSTHSVVGEEYDVGQVVLCREASIMKALKHPNIMKLIDVPTKDPYNERTVLVMEYVEAGSLASQIHFLRRFTETKLWFPMKQMADAFEYLHAQNIVHRDIKMSHDKTDFNVGNSPPTFGRETLVSVLAAMLRKDPMERLTMTEMVNHMWFKENDPINYIRNAESKLSDESVEEETPTGQANQFLNDLGQFCMFSALDLLREDMVCEHLAGKEEDED
uniref:protein kinase 2-like n=1 Tax=Myxine glutinosa TaxID=7769 RepID=UPI00358EF510